MHGRNGVFFEPLEEIRSRAGVVGRRYRRTQAAFMRCRTVVGESAGRGGRRREMSAVGEGGEEIDARLESPDEREREDARPLRACEIRQRARQRKRERENERRKRDGMIIYRLDDISTR